MKSGWDRRVLFSRTMGARGVRREVYHTRHSAPPTVSGFTLLEVLISLTILGLIFVAVLGAVQVGSRSWEKGERRVEENLRNRTLYDTLARELTMLYPLRIKEQDKEIITFRGSSDSLTFATLPQGYGAEPFNHMIRIVTYAVEPGRGLVATESYPLLQESGRFGSQEVGVTGFDDRVTEARFRYLVLDGKPDEKLPPTWRDFWDPSQDGAGQGTLKGSDRLPSAIEITITMRQANQSGGRDLTLPPLVFPVQVGRTL